MTTLKVFGTGCANCKRLEQLCIDTVAEMKIDAKVEKVTDLMEIMQSGIMATPGLSINWKVVSSGKIPTKETLKHWIEENR
ncbi:MAG: redox-active disulfide protein 2 [Ignavibacteriaceae bacterium]|nr:MAG: redox-active disulfide protein 2 [Ignavibacteriaceae bacterium]